MRAQLYFVFFTNHAFDRRTDRQTGRQTDRILIARPHLHSMQRGKNYKVVHKTPQLSSTRKHLELYVASKKHTIKIINLEHMVTGHWYFLDDCRDRDMGNF